MIIDFPLFPEQASSMAGRVDALYWFLILLCGSVAILIAILILVFALKFRRRSEDEYPTVHAGIPEWMEIAWIVVPLIIFMGIFVWGAKLFFDTQRPPDNAIEIYATAKQWMWKFQHTEGPSEINELHVPVGKPVKIMMASEDVIHSFFVPAFRVKKDVLPSRYTYVWFTATKPGRYHLFCAEYCGTDHSGMIGWVTVMEPTAYQAWLAGGAGEGTPAVEGKKLFDKYACNTCHTSDATGRGPVLAGLYGKQVLLDSGQLVTADENYLRESILNSQAKVVSGFQPIMPLFQGQINESQTIQLIAYIKSLTPQNANQAPAVESPQSKIMSSGSQANPEAGEKTKAPGTK